MSKLTYSAVRHSAVRVLVASILVVAAGCGGGEPGESATVDPPADDSPTATSATADSPTTGATTPAPSDQPTDQPTDQPSDPASDATAGPTTRPVSAYCDEPKAPARWISLSGPGANRIAAAVVGSGPVTAVYSHQIDDGLCGFWAFAVWLADTHGIRSILVDHCGTASSACTGGPFSYDRVGQLKLAVDWARAHGGRRVSLVGASLGGTAVTVAAARIRPAVDAVINLSGPLRSLDLNARRAAPRVTAPTLLALAPSDGAATIAEFRRLLSALGARTKRFVRGRVGHGWDLLGDDLRPRFRPYPFATTVAAWLHGDYVGG